MSKLNSNIFNREISFQGKFNDKLKEHFYNELGSLLQSGVDIQRSLTILIDEQTNKKVKQTLEDILEGLTKGMSLADLCEKSGEFTSYEFQSIRIGEETGRLQSVLFNLSEFFENKIKLRRQMISVFSYPIFVLVITIAVLYFMLSVLVPMFSDVFGQFGQELPSLTKRILNLSAFFSKYGMYFLIGLLVLVVFVYLQRKEEWFRKMSSSTVVRIPIFGDLIQKVYLARMSQSFSLLLGARTPLVRSLEMVEEMIGFYPIEKALSEIKKQVKQGGQLNESMANFSIFDSRMIAMTKISEEINNLDQAYTRLAKQYQKDVEHKTKLIGTVMEPLMILIIGLIVGVIVIAMYLPMFNLPNIIQ